MTSSNEALKRRVEAVLDMAVTTVGSLSEAFTSGAPLAGEDAGLGQEDLEKILDNEETVSATFGSVPGDEDKSAKIESQTE